MENRVRSFENLRKSTNSSLSFIDDDNHMAMKELQKSSAYGSKNELSPSPERINDYTDQRGATPVTYGSLKASTNYDALADGGSANSFASPLNAELGGMQSPVTKKESATQFTKETSGKKDDLMKSMQSQLLAL